MDLESGRIAWGSSGRGKAGLKGFWPRLRRSRARSRAGAMDRSGASGAAVGEPWPGGPRVFAKFHIIQWMNQRLADLRREWVREAEGPMKRVIQGTPYLLRTRADNLAEEQLPKLERARQLQEPLSLGGSLKEELGLLWEQSSSADMNRFLSPGWERARPTGGGQLQKMAQTLAVPRSGIWSWWTHPINNGRMAGTNNKSKTLNRQA